MKKHWPLFLSSGLVFATSFVTYLLTLAPSVTLEDSGELITAAYYLGVPHQPGYPLFAMLGKLFSLLPVGSIAFRLNLMSAFFTSVGAVFVCLSVIHLLENITGKVKKNRNQQETAQTYLKYAAGISAGLFMAFSYETWEQSLITEVYGLHAFFTGLFLYLYARFKAQTENDLKRKYSNAIFLVIGLALTNHSTSIFLVPLFLLDLLITDRSFLFNTRTIYQGLIAGLIGLLPLIYLPLASMGDPVIDWGNPENLTNFLRTISRHQYTNMEQDMPKYLTELRFYFGHLLTGQWYPIYLILLVPAVAFLYKRSRNFLLFSILFLFFTILVTTYVADFDIRGNDQNAQANRDLVTVFYIPSYILFAMLMGLGLFYVASFIRNKYLVISAAIVITALPTLNFIQNHKDVDMHDFRLADQFCRNLFDHVPDSSLVIAHVDYMYFPTLYYQYVLGERQDLVILDQELLRRSWYIDMLRVNHPDLVSQASNEVERFVASLEPFESGREYDGNTLQRYYTGMINAFLDNSFKSGKEVYYTVIPAPEVLRGYNVESTVYAFRLYDGDNKSVEAPGKVDLSDFQKVTDDDIFFSRYIRDYYLELLIIRGRDMEFQGKYKEAIAHYRQVLDFKVRDIELRNFTVGKIEALGRMTDQGSLE